MRGSAGRSLKEQLDEAMGELQEHQQKLATLHEELRKATATVRSKDRTLEVTIGNRGDVQEIHFHGTDYRMMAPVELSAVLVETIAAARREMAGKVNAAFAPLRGFGARLRESMAGGSELDDVMAPLRAMLRPADRAVTTEQEDWNG
ncbi:YbaB/EbfC family nucleoid-associated protein [Streptomyces sp. IBSBF 2435]|uniref:YbaB/EbfC family nucleoid-associated protein n=1 Tax=Streptomyces sp. IBSBF 2435 TaxID=2903531 RepID=UPI002FDC75D3